MRRIGTCNVFEVAAWWSIEEYDHVLDVRQKVDQWCPQFRAWKSKPEYTSQLSQTVIKRAFSSHRNWELIRIRDWERYELAIQELSKVIINPILPDWQERARDNYTLASLAASAGKSEEPWAKEIKSLAKSAVDFDPTLVMLQTGEDVTQVDSWGLIDGMHRGPTMVLRGRPSVIPFFGGLLHK